MLAQLCSTPRTAKTLPKTITMGYKLFQKEALSYTQETKFILHNHNYDTIEKAKLSGDMSEPQLSNAGEGGKDRPHRSPENHKVATCVHLSEF